MAMNAGILGKAIASHIIDANAPADMKKQIEQNWTNIAQEIINHIVNNADIVVAAGIPVSTTGSAVAQTGVTTSPGKGKITG